MIRERTEAAVPVAPVSFGPGQRLLMDPVDFREYAKATEGAVSRLRKVLKATHQLERTVPELPYMRPSASRDVVDVQLRIERLLRDPNRSLEQGIEELQAIVAQVRSMIDQLLAELEGRQDIR